MTTQRSLRKPWVPGTRQVPCTLFQGLPVILRVGGAIFLGGGVFWGVAMLLDVEEADLVPRMIMRRLRG